MSDKVDPDIPSIELGMYRHSKSGETYEVIGTALHSETHEALVIYRPITYKSKYELFARPYGMFVELVTLEGHTRPRFEKIN